LPQLPTISIAGLNAGEPADLLVDLLDAAGNPLCSSNPLRVAADAPLQSYWCDLRYSTRLGGSRLPRLLRAMWARKLGIQGSRGKLSDGVANGLSRFVRLAMPMLQNGH
jgi:hypothetical protein